MLGKIRKPTADFNHNIPAIISRFNFERPARVVGRSSTDDSLMDSTIDPDIHNGTIVCSNGYARLARHKPTGAICLITSKASVNLQGEMRENGQIQATTGGLERSYIAAAYQSNGTNDDMTRLAPRLRRDRARFFEDLSERSEKHFTLYGATVNKDPKTMGRRDIEQTDIFTNGRLSYVLSKVGEKYIVRFYAPTQRKDGSFIPVHTEKTGLARHFASAAKNIAIADTYEDAHDQMSKHWQRLSSKLWDEKNIFSGEGKLFQAKKLTADAVHHLLDNGPRIALVTVLVGVASGLLFSKYGGIAGGVIAAIAHTAMHILADEGYEASTEAVHKAKEARKKLDITAYDYNEDCSDHFKIQTKDNINKLCAKMDMKRFKASDFEFLTSDQSKMLLDHDTTLDGFRPSSLRAHLLGAHQRGFSSSCFLPDNNTRVDAMQSGLVRLLHEKQDGTVVLYARYRADACTDERLRLPEDRRDRMGDKIWRFEYDRSPHYFHHAFKRTMKEISVDDMMDDVKKLLFRDNNDMLDHDTKQRSYNAVQELFTLPSETTAAQNENLYLSGRPIRPPYLKSFARLQTA